MSVGLLPWVDEHDQTESSIRMTPPSATYDYTEDATVEQPAIDLFGELGWETAGLFHEWTSGKSSEERETEHEIILVKRLRASEHHRRGCRERRKGSENLQAGMSRPPLIQDWLRSGPESPTLAPRKPKSASWVG